jgi:hypothetical protein
MWTSTGIGGLSEGISEQGIKRQRTTLDKVIGLKGARKTAVHVDTSEINGNNPKNER